MQRIYYFLNKEKQEIESTVYVRKLHFTFLYIYANSVSGILLPTPKILSQILWDVHISWKKHVFWNLNAFGLQLALDWARYSKS